MITSVTAWKKALQPGNMVRVVNHAHPAMNGTRPVLRVQTNAFSTRYVRPDGEVVESWFYYPKSSKELRLSDEGQTLTRLGEQGQEELSYTVVKPFNVDWQDASTATYTAEAVVINDHVVTVCLDDEGPMTPAFYWDIVPVTADSQQASETRAEHLQFRPDPKAEAVDSGWARTPEQAKEDAVMAAMRLPA